MTFHETIKFNFDNFIKLSYMYPYSPIITSSPRSFPGWREEGKGTVYLVYNLIIGERE